MGSDVGVGIDLDYARVAIIVGVRAQDSLPCWWASSKGRSSPSIVGSLITWHCSRVVRSTRGDWSEMGVWDKECS